MVNVAKPTGEIFLPYKGFFSSSSALSDIVPVFSWIAVRVYVRREIARMLRLTWKGERSYSSYTSMCKTFTTSWHLGSFVVTSCQVISRKGKRGNILNFAFLILVKDCYTMAGNSLSEHVKKHGLIVSRKPYGKASG